MQRIVFGFMILASLILMANSGGRGRPSVLAPNDSTQTCGSFGCHNGTNFNPELQISLLNMDGESVTEYNSDEEYNVVLKINHDGNPSGYGFQLVSILGQDETGVNNFSDFEEGIKDFVNNGKQYVEQSRTLSSDSISIKWTAPASGSGDVIFYGAGNAVNGNRNPNGDGADTSSVVIKEKITSSLIENIGNIDVTLYPNPTQEILYFSAQVDRVEINRMDGTRAYANYKEISQLDMSDLESGVYLLTIYNGETASTQKIVKL